MHFDLPKLTTPGGRRRSRPLFLAALGLVGILGASGAVTALAAGDASGAIPSARPAAQAPTVTSPVAVFLGDSYTAGVGASTASLRWSTLVAREAGWTELNQGGAGTGYDTISDVSGCGAQYCPAYVRRAMQVVSDGPDVVVVAGGQNDRQALTADPAEVRAAVDETFRLIRQGLPDARIIAVGPSTPTPAAPVIQELDSWVREAADQVDADYVSLLAPAVIAAPMVMPDRVHVNDAGHLAIARRVLSTVDAG